MKTRNSFTWIFLILGGTLPVSTIAGDDQFHWFKEEITCNAFKIKVRSYCYDEGEEFQRRNHYCSKQQIYIQHPNGKTYKKQLTFRKYWSEKLTARALQCMNNQAGKTFFMISFSNGGNCDFCESYDLMDEKGNWLTKHGNNLDGAANRAGININPWTGDRFIYFSNTTVDEGDQK
jgi:hypothetical protein